MPEMQVLEKHEERRYTLGVVYEPNVEDTDGAPSPPDSA